MAKGRIPPTEAVGGKNHIRILENVTDGSSSWPSLRRRSVYALFQRRYPSMVMAHSGVPT